MKTLGNWTVEDLFAGKAESLELFHAVRLYIESLGPVKTEAMKSQISFGTRTKFAWVWLPPSWAKNRSENSIILTFGLRRHVEHERIVQAVEPRPGRWTHHVIIEKQADLDEDVRAWLREAHAFSMDRRIHHES
jgi:hypothetical protein